MTHEDKCEAWVKAKRKYTKRFCGLKWDTVLISPEGEEFNVVRYYTPGGVTRNWYEEMEEMYN